MALSPILLPVHSFIHSLLPSQYELYENKDHICFPYPWNSSI